MDSQSLQVITNHVLSDVTYCGIPTRKNPLDVWIYQELIWRTKPDVILEFGTFMGGSALMFLHMLEHVSHSPLVITVDIDANAVQSLYTSGMYEQNIKFVHGSAVSNCVVEYIHNTVNSKPVMIVEDSSHEYANTLAILRLYNDLIHPYDCIIVEDTICHHGLEVGPNPGPYEAVQQFLAENGNFVVDKDCEKFGLTYNPNGFLRRVK